MYVKGDVFETPRTVTWRQVQRSKLQRERLDHLKAELRRASRMTESASELVKALRKFGTTLEYIPMKSRQGVSWEQVQKDLCRERVVICGKPVTDHLAAKGGLPELERILVSAVGEHYWSNMDSHSSTLRPLRLRGSALWHCTHEIYQKLRAKCRAGHLVSYAELLSEVRRVTLMKNSENESEKQKEGEEKRIIITPTKRNRTRRTPRGKRGTMKPVIQDENSDAAIARDVALMWQLLSLVDWTLQAACRTESGGDSYMQVFNLFEDLNVLVTPSHTAKNQNTEIKVYNQRIVVRTYNTYEAVHDARNDPRRSSTMSVMSTMSTDVDEEDEDLHKNSYVCSSARILLKSQMNYTLKLYEHRYAFNSTRWLRRSFRSVTRTWRNF